MNHGHVTPNPNGARARCGGPAICPRCAAEQAAIDAKTYAQRPNPAMPSQFDEYAAVVANRISAVDRNRLKGGDSQFEAIVHSAIVEAMFQATRVRPGLTNHDSGTETVRLSRERAHFDRDIEAMAIAQMTDQQVEQSWYRWRLVREAAC